MQTLRILSDFDPGHPIGSLDEVRPRLDRAQCWVATQLPASQRTRLQDEPDRAALAGLSDSERGALKLLVDGLDEHWSLEGLSQLVYAVPKLQAGLPPTPSRPRS